MTGLLGGRVVHLQDRAGHRTGIEPVLLAASLAVRPGQRVLEGGTGSGAALLCLAVRCPGVIGVGIERDPRQADVARENLRQNRLAGVQIVTGDLMDTTLLDADMRFDHAMANPPWHLPGGTPSPDAGQEAARRAAAGLFGAWIAALARRLRHRGSLTLVVSAGCLVECLAGYAAAGCGSVAVLPLWPKAGREAKLILLRGVRGGRGPARVLPGLVLHAPDGGYTPQAEAVLRGGEAIDWERSDGFAGGVAEVP